MTQEELDDELIRLCNDKSDNTKKISMLIIIGADVNARGGCPLENCCRVGNFKHVKLLVELGADVNNNRSPLPSALVTSITYNLLKIVKYLVENGANIHDTTWTNPLVTATRLHRLGIVKYFIKKGVDVSSGDSMALRVAVVNNDVEIAKLLIENGAITNVRGGECLQAAIKNRNWEMIELLVKNGGHLSHKIRKLPDDVTRFIEDIIAREYARKK